jgi:hypothetical protein
LQFKPIFYGFCYFSDFSINSKEKRHFNTFFTIANNGDGDGDHGAIAHLIG